MNATETRAADGSDWPFPSLGAGRDFNRRGRRRTAILLACLLLITGCANAAAAPCQVQVVLFIPADVRPPVGYQQRVDQIVSYTEAFFEREFRRWGYDRPVSPFRRAADGSTEVLLLRGRQKTDQYKPVTVRAETMDELRRRNRLEGGRQVWWIMVFAGDPPAKFAGFLGGFGVEIGGWSVCNFNTTPGRIDPATPLGSELLEKIMLKGMIHELGHAFQLPHIGPLQGDHSGNTLMGPTHINYRRVVPTGDERVYLSQAAAAMLSLHPAFRGVPDERSPLPTVAVQALNCAPDPSQTAINVTGRVKASQRAIFAFVADESAARPGEYWTKTYVGKVTPDGSFKVAVSEPSPTHGTLRIWFGFETGIQTGDGKQRGRESGLAQNYTYSRQQWSFK